MLVFVKVRIGEQRTVGFVTATTKQDAPRSRRGFSSRLHLIATNVAEFLRPSNKLPFPAFPLFSGQRFVVKDLDLACRQLQSGPSGFRRWPAPITQVASVPKVLG